MLWLIAMVVFFALFIAMVWRMSAGPTNEEEGIAVHNLPGASTTLPQFGPYPLSPGPELGTPESLESVDVDRALEREHHRRRFDEERRD